MIFHSYIASLPEGRYGKSMVFQRTWSSFRTWSIFLVVVRYICDCISLMWHICDLRTPFSSDRNKFWVGEISDNSCYPSKSTIFPPFSNVFPPFSHGFPMFSPWFRLRRELRRRGRRGATELGHQAASRGGLVLDEHDLWMVHINGLV